MGNTQDNVTNKSLEIFVKVIRMVVGIPLMLICAVVAVVGAAETGQKLIAYGQVGVFPLAAVMFEVSLALLFVIMTVGSGRLAFEKMREKIPRGMCLWLGVVMFVASVTFSIISEEQRYTWQNYDYPPYIETQETKVLYKNVDCTYNQNLYFSGYIQFLANGFKENQQIQVVEDPSLVDRYRVEVYYKGMDSKLDVWQSSYNSKPEERISLRPIGYDYERTAYDWAYMYKFKVDFEYAEPIAIERIIIRTAYPDMVDISGINN